MAIAAPDLARLALAAACWGLGTVISKAALTELSNEELLDLVTLRRPT